MDQETRHPDGDEFIEGGNLPMFVVPPFDGKRWSFEDFELGLKLGTGSIGTFYLAREKSSHVLVTMKVMHKAKVLEESSQENLYREIEIQRNLQRGHPTILPLLTYLQDQSYFALILDPYLGSVRQKLKDVGRLDDALTVNILMQVASALSFCHSQRVMHRDIKPENIRLGPSNRIKLADFALARVKNPSHGLVHTTQCGTPPYRAPEMVGKLPYDEKVDIWSLGVVLYEMLVGHPPFGGKSTSMVNAIMNVDYSCDFAFVQQGSKHLISQFLQKDPNHRIELNQVPNHSWIEEVLRRPVVD